MNSSDFSTPESHSEPGALTTDIVQAAPEQGLRGFQQAIAGPCAAALDYLRALVSRGLLTPKRQRRLRVSETISLGEKRFLSIVEVDGQDFLIGGGATGVALLAHVAPAARPPSFHEAAQEAWQKAESA